jgi:MFS family permease
MFFPSTATPDSKRLIFTRALRGLGDGFVSVYLAMYLQLIGLSTFQIGAILTGMLIGSAVLTLLAGLVSHRISTRRVLFAAALLMGLTGAGFASVSTFWLLFFIAFVGTLNPSAGDVSVFLPTEQAILAGEVSARDRTALFARYTLAGSLFGAFGALASGLPEIAARRFGLIVVDAFRAGFVVYTVLALIIALIYARLEHGSKPAAANGNIPLRRSRGIVARLTVLFALDAFGGGFVIDSLVILWLFLRFDLSLQVVGAVFFGTRMLAALSQLVSPYLAVRFGPIETMVFTHIPANLFLVLAALMPGASLAVMFLLVRTAFSSMDVPVRQSYVMSVVPPEERAAAASMTSVPRSLASAVSPLIAGSLLQLSIFGWPLVIGGVLKITYDILLLVQFRHIRPSE